MSERYERHPEWYRVRSELLDKGWARVRAQPERTEASARGMFYSASRAAGLPMARTTFSRCHADCIVGYIATVVDDEFDIREL